MDENKEIATDELLEWAKLNNINISEGQAKELTKEETESIDLDEWFKQNNMTPIGEYENLTKKMKSKIKEIILSLKEQNEKEKLEETNETEENNSLDEKDEKEEIIKDKKEKVAEKDRKNVEKKEGKEEQDKEKKEELAQNKQSKEEVNNKEQETPKKDEYLSNVKKLHDMKIRDYKDQMKKDNTKMDKYFVTMMYLQRDINRQRDNFIKEYGNEELKTIENDYLKEELKYEKTLNMYMEKDLGNLRALDEKLDTIIDKMQTLQKSLEDENISIQEYNDKIDALEQDKLDTLWQINKANPELLEEKQENIESRDMYERKVAAQNIGKRKDISSENKAKSANIEYNEKKQDGLAEEIHENMKDAVKNDVDQKEKRLDELRKELKAIDITSPKGKKEALEIIGEIQTLESQKMSQETQLNNLEKNMEYDVNSYSDLQNTEVERRESSEEYQENMEDINPAEISNNLMAELKSQALEDPSTPEQAEEYLDNINEISEDAEKKQEQDKQKENEENETPTLWNRRKRPY